jgi:hypothetical protein
LNTDIKDITSLYLRRSGLAKTGSSVAPAAEFTEWKVAPPIENHRLTGQFRPVNVMFTARRF